MWQIFEVFSGQCSDKIVLMNFEHKKCWFCLLQEQKGKNRKIQAAAELPVLSILSSYTHHNANKHIFQNVKQIFISVPQQPAIFARA